MPHLKLRDGAELYYETHGSGPPLFLVPGLGGDGRFWTEHVAELARTFTVVVHDHRGTGRSTLSKIDYSVRWTIRKSIGAAIPPAARWARCWRSSIPSGSTGWC
jgi:pimeloyl-ACP methyl ester carboxylesterase